MRLSFLFTVLLPLQVLAAQSPYVETPEIKIELHDIACKDQSGFKNATIFDKKAKTTKQGCWKESQGDVIVCPADSDICLKFNPAAVKTPGGAGSTVRI